MATRSTHDFPKHFPTAGSLKRKISNGDDYATHVAKMLPPTTRDVNLQGIHGLMSVFASRLTFTSCCFCRSQGSYWCRWSLRSCHYLRRVPQASNTHHAGYGAAWCYALLQLMAELFRKQIAQTMRRAMKELALWQLRFRTAALTYEI